MANRVKILRSNTAAARPASGGPPGMLWVNFADGVLGWFDADGEPVELPPGGIPDAPSDSVLRARKDGAWTTVAIADVVGLSASLTAIDDDITALEDAVAVSGLPTVVAVTDTTHIPGLGVPNRYFRCTNAAGCAVTIPTNTAQAFPVGTMLTYEQVDDDPITFAGDSGVTLNCPASRDPETAEQYAVVQICKVGTNEWVIYGNLAAA